MSNHSTNKKPTKASPAASKAPAPAAAAPKFVVLDLSTAANNNANTTTNAASSTSPLKAEHAGTVARSASLHDQLAPEDQEDLEALDMDDDDEPQQQQQKSQKQKPQQQQQQQPAQQQQQPAQPVQHAQPAPVDQKTEVKAAPVKSFSKSGINDDEDKGTGDVQFSDSTFWKSNYTFGDMDLELELEDVAESRDKAPTSFYTPSKSFASVSNTPSSVAKETSAPPSSPAYFVKLPITAGMSNADREEHAADEKRVTYVDSNFWRQNYAYNDDELEEL